MSQQRIKTIGVTAAVFLIALVSTGLFVREITKQSELLRDKVTAIQQDLAQQTQLAQLKKRAEETTAARTTLNSYYLETQSDSINFLNYIETLAQTERVEVVSTAPTEVTRNNTELLVVRYSLLGSRQQLERFLQLLESVQYVSQVTEFDLSNQTSVNWSAQLTIEVIVLENHETDE